MEKIFAPYDLAKKLKEKGFDEPCFGYYSNIDKGKLRISGTVNHNGTNYSGIESCYLAPTYQQAFKWFRDNHNLNGEVYQILLLHNNEYREQKKEIEYTFKIILKGIPQFQSIENIFPSYEEAELKCLKELIKLIQ